MLVAWLVAGCSVVAEAPPPPQTCAQVYTAPRCLAMVDEAASRSGRTRDDVTAIEIVPEPPSRDGVLVTRGGAAPINVRLTFKDGTVTDTPMCVGIPSGPACTDPPRLEARSAVAAAQPLLVARFPIPIDHLGAYEVSLGVGSLPNGVASMASFTFVDDWPVDVSLKDGVAQIELRSLEPDGKPFQNYYDHGWRPGIERVETVLVFHVLWFADGAVLGIRDVVVR
jgi:hypothetical protein